MFKIVLFRKLWETVNFLFPKILDLQCLTQYSILMFDPTNTRYRYLNLKNDKSVRRYSNSSSGIEKINGISKSSTELPHGSYGALLFRLEWQTKRAAIIERDKCCVICQNTESLQIHHRQYHFVVAENKFKLPWDYPDFLLIALCESCHRRGHAKFKVPTINI
ncbi:HNH endonuclease [Flavobacterium soyae]|uniref:HNH endonuclease n=1 Tax=Flavobacterium soyae TaxID=2903098 RepID=UPI001E38BAA1|nr:HNH endonuclease signature motif containing protein [Flavobacterium soyae]MCD9574455.1 HNH endonuclease [Flavobacterium soyae]